MTRRGRQSVTFSLFSFQDIITSVTGIMVLATLILALELIQHIENSPAQRSREIAGQLEDAALDTEQLEAAVLQNEARTRQLQQALAQGTTRLNELAGFDFISLRNEAAELDHTNEKLDSQLADLNARRDRAERQEEETRRLRDLIANQPQTMQELLETIEQKKRTLEELRESQRVIYNTAPGDPKQPWLVQVGGDQLVAAEVGVSAPPQVFPDAAAFAAWLPERDSAADYFVLLVQPEGIENYAAARQVLHTAGFDVGYDLLASDQHAIDPEKGAAVE